MHEDRPVGRLSSDRQHMSGRLAPRSQHLANRLVEDADAVSSASQQGDSVTHIGLHAHVHEAMKKQLGSERRGFP